MKNLINEDYEREALKDQVFLAEMQKQMENEWQQWEEEQNRKAAKIKVEITSEVKEIKNETIFNVLPF